MTEIVKGYLDPATGYPDLDGMQTRGLLRMSDGKVFDLTSGQLRDTTATDRISKSTGYVYAEWSPDKKVKVIDINPKVLPTEDLYGHINLVTREWKDGLLSRVMRDLANIPTVAPKWIVLDGDLDANW